MTPQLERKDNLVQEKQVLAKTFERFYQKNDRLFSAQDKTVAEKYFYGIGEELPLERLLDRQRQCVDLCEQSINFASEQRKKFFALLISLPIAFDRKRTLREQFLTGDFQVKAQLLDLLHQEEKRIALKREAQKAVIESLKNQFVNFYSSNATYFNEFDRELAINYALSSIEKFRTHIGKMGRLHMLLAMLPANLAYARELDEKYQNLLVQKIHNENERGSMLGRFRNGNFAHKNELLKALSELRIVIEEKKKDIETQAKVEEKIVSAEKSENHLQEKAVLKEKEKKINDIVNVPISEPQGTVKESLPANNVCSIAIRIIQNHRGKKYNTDKEILEDIEMEMKQDNISGNFSEENLKAMRNILPQLPQQYWGTTSAAVWMKRELQAVTAVQEYSH